MYNRYYPYLYNRSEPPLVPKCPQQPEPPPLPPKPKNPHKPPKNKLNFKTLKKDTCTSLNDVEYFLNNFSHSLKYIKLINLLK